MEVHYHFNTTINITTSSFPTSNPFPHKKLSSFSNLFRANKNNAFQVSILLTQQVSNKTLTAFSIYPHNFAIHKYPLSLSKSNATESPYATTPSNSTAACSSENSHWMVILDRPPDGLHSKDEITDYFASILQKALSRDKNARSLIYNVSCDNQFGFCCNIDEGTSQILASLPGVILVKPDPDFDYLSKSHNTSHIQDNSEPNSQNGCTLLFPEGFKHWLVVVDRPSDGFSSKAQAVDFYVNIIMKVLGNAKDAQMCIYHVSWESNYGFCCVLDEECAQELAAVPGILSVKPDEHFESASKDYGGSRLLSDSPDSAQTTEISKTKLFITGLSFYTSEKTLRAAFEPFGELVEVKVIMDKISKRSKGYAFVEYTTEEAATSALKEMSGKIINGWMIVVDRAKRKPNYSQTRPRLKSLHDR